MKSLTRVVKTWRNPIKECVCCLYTIGLGVKRISRTVGVAPSVAFRWVKKRGILDSRRSSTPWNKGRRDKSVLGGIALEKQAVLKRRAERKARHNTPEAVATRRLKQIQQYRKPKVRLRGALRARLRKVIKREHRSGKSVELVGCSPDALMHHLQSRFKKGMAWNNYGTEWHIDHIVPCSKFNLIDPAEQKRCFHFSNLRPLWAKDNLKKSDTIEPCQPELCIDMRHSSQYHNPHSI